MDRRVDRLPVKPENAVAAPAGHAAGMRPAMRLGAAALIAWAGTATWLALRPVGDAGDGRIAAVSAAYETRISALRREIDRISSSELVKQDDLDRRINQLMARQAQIESRQTALSGLSDGARFRMAPVAASIASPARQVVQQDKPQPFAKPMPAFDDLPLRGAAEPERQSSLPASVPVAAAGALVRKVDAAERSLQAAELAQMRQIETASLDMREDEARLRGLFARLGLPVPRQPDAAESGVGGPLVPLPSAGPIDRMLADARGAAAAVERLRREAAALPLQKPLTTALEATSEYGYRRDPFTRVPALHTGVDLRGETGMPALATAPGTVVTAEWSGGYGNLVEIDHGNGIATRYGHLSAIGVSVGEKIAAGGAVGRVGSTGRSTASHLHYEVRINGEPVDPQRFLDTRVAELARGLF